MERNDEADLALRWSGSWMLLHRILAVNVFAVAILAGSIFYLDGFRSRLTANAIANAETQAEIARGRLRMDPARHRVRWNHRDVTLTVTEFMILEALAQRPGVVKSRNQLMDVAYHDDIYVDDRTIDSHIKRLRRKFRQVDGEFKAIETLYGVGYRFGEE